MKYEIGKFDAYRRKIFFLVDVLDFSLGGLESSLFNRAIAFCEMGLDVTLLVYGEDFNFKERYKEYLCQGMLPENLKVENFWLDSGFRSERVKQEPENVSNDFYVRLKDASKEAYRCYENGVYVRYESYQDGKLWYTYDVAEDRSFKARNVYAGHLNPVKREVFDKEGVVSLVRYFDVKGECYLTRWKADWSKGRVIIFDRGAAKEFPSLKSAINSWVKRKVGENDSLLFSDYRRCDSLVSDMPATTKCVAVVHMNHNVKKDKNLTPAYKHLFNSGDFEKIVVFTDSQKQDILKLGVEEAKIFVAKNFYLKDNKYYYKEKGKENLIVSLARYVEPKRLDHAIKVIAQVKEYIPDVVYKIYGQGNKKDDLEKLIREMGLEGNVYLMGRTNKALEDLSVAKCSLYTSMHEAFLLAIIESMSVGVPVVSYNINYGPSDQISNGNNGFIVDEGNVELAAIQVARILKSEDLQRSLSKASIESAENYSYSNFLATWKELLDELE